MKQGVRVTSSAGPTLIRAVTHLDVSRADVEEAARIITEVAQVASAIDHSGSSSSAVAAEATAGIQP